MPVRAWTRGGEAFDVLDVNGGEDVDVVIEEIEDVFIALGEAAALYVGVGEFVDEGYLRVAGEDGVDVHLGEERALVGEFAAGDLLELGSEFGCAGAAVGFDDADDYILASAVAADAFAEHGEGFADARSVAEKDLEAAAALLAVAGEQPVFRGFAFWSVCLRQALECLS